MEYRFAFCDSFKFSLFTNHHSHQFKMILMLGLISSFTRSFWFPTSTHTKTAMESVHQVDYSSLLVLWDTKVFCRVEALSSPYLAMKSSARLDSVVFQLTPTRTRFELVLKANGKTELLASGLLNPFLTHLKSAQEQIGKGGYSIVLEPHHVSDLPWFTKGTVERFVRFVSTPEVLERVYSIESEMSQILEAISFQNINGVELHRQVQDHQIHKESSEAASIKQYNHNASKSGIKAITSSNEEKAIVVYKSYGLETDQSNILGETSKTQLLRVLETRKHDLQKEQGMAFAQAAAAGFDIDHIASLMSFAECFGATRMMDSCLKFMDLLKAKHESGQWVELEEVEACLDDEVPAENRGLKPQIDNHEPSHMKELLLGQFPHHPTHSPRPIHPQSSQIPLFQPYSLPIPYYQNYLGNGRFFQPQYTSVDQPRLYSGRIVKQRRHSMDNGDLYTESDIQHSDVSSKSEVCHSSDQQHYSDSGSELYSASCDDDDDDKTMNESCSLRNEDIQRRSKQQGIQRRHEGDDGHWQTFQNILLRDAQQDGNLGKSSMYVKEGKGSGRKRQDVAGDGCSLLRGQQMDSAVDNNHDIMLSRVGRNIAYTRTANGSDGLMISEHDKLSVTPPFPSDPYIVDQFGYQNVHNRSSSHDLADEGFVAPCRSSSIDQFECDGRMVIDMDSELPKALASSEKSENEKFTHDLALDHELQAAKVDCDEESTVDVSQRNKSVDNVQGSKSQKNVIAVTKRGKPSKLSPAEEARAHAEKLCPFKVDLQKLKKDKEEEEEIKRLEALKTERQKRITSRSSCGTLARSPSSSTQTKQLLPKKISPGFISSKFSDAETGSSSPLQRSTVKTISRLPGCTQKAFRPGRLNFIGHSNENILTRSTSSLIELKEENNRSIPDPKALMARFRRLSEPKCISYPASDIKAPNEKPLSGIKETHLTVKSEDATVIGGSVKVLTRDDFIDETVVEKTVLMLECEKTSAARSVYSLDPTKAKRSEGVAVHPQIFPNNVKEINEIIVECQLQKVSSSNEAGAANCAEKLLPNTSTLNLTEKPNNSTLQSMEKSVYRTVPPPVYTTTTTASELTPANASYGTTVHFLSDSEQHRIDKMWDVPEKPQEKESKGLKRFLKFRRKRHNSTAGESNLDHYLATHDGSIGDYNASHVASSDGVSSFKTAVSQREGSSDHTKPHKSLRSLSLLSVFRFKTGEKKLNT